MKQLAEEGLQELMMGLHLIRRLLQTGILKWMLGHLL
jgi:hypothetical protein